MFSDSSWQTGAFLSAALFVTASLPLVPPAAAEPPHAPTRIKTDAPVDTRVCLLLYSDSSISFATIHGPSDDARPHMQAMPAAKDFFKRKLKEDWAIAIAGLAHAFRDEKTIKALSEHFPFAVRAVDFSVATRDRTGWVMMNTPQDLIDFSLRLEDLSRVIRSHTYTVKAMLEAPSYFADCPQKGPNTRHVLDIATDGTDTQSNKLAGATSFTGGVYRDTRMMAARDALDAQDIQINAIGFKWTTGAHPEIDDHINLEQMLRDNMVTQQRWGKVFIVENHLRPNGTPDFDKIVQRIAEIYAEKLIWEIAGIPPKTTAPRRAALPVSTQFAAYRR